MESLNLKAPDIISDALAVITVIVMTGENLVAPLDLNQRPANYVLDALTAEPRGQNVWRIRQDSNLQPIS